MTLSLEMKDYEIMRRGLLELPAKDSMLLIAKLDQQILAQAKGGEDDSNKNNGDN